MAGRDRFWLGHSPRLLQLSFNFILLPRFFFPFHGYTMVMGPIVSMLCCPHFDRCALSLSAVSIERSPCFWGRRSSSSRQQTRVRSPARKVLEKGFLSPLRANIADEVARLVLDAEDRRIASVVLDPDDG